MLSGLGVHAMKQRRCSAWEDAGRRLAGVALLLVCSGSVSLAAQPVATSKSCIGTPVHVSAADEDERLLVCEAAQQAVGFFQRYGLLCRDAIRVNVRETVWLGEGSFAIGRYDRATELVELLSLDDYRRRYPERRFFKTPMNRALYRSFGVHEIAHAMADKQFQITPVPWLAQEYIAAVIQFATMEPLLRGRILDRYGLKAFETTEAMSSLYYQLDPAAFAVKAYLHFRGLEDQEAFLKDLFSGRILLGDDEDWLALSK